MPPEGEGTPLSAEEITGRRAWIDQGANAPADERPKADPRKHWAFRPPVRPPVPQLSGDRSDWVRNPIDAFLADARAARAHPAPARRPRRAAPPRLPRPDRPGPHPRGAPGLPRRPVRPGLREGRRPPAGQPAVRRALGPALDGRLAVQRLGRLRRRGPREPAAHLALARLDRRVAQRRQGLRPDGRRDARRRRGRPGRPRRPSAPPASSSATGTSSTATSGSTTRSSTRPRPSSA